MTHPLVSPVPDDASLAAIVALVRRHIRLLLAVPLTLAVLAVFWNLSRPRSFTARASFLPQRSDMPRSGLGAIASQFGLDLNLDRTGQSPAFYAELMQTPQLLGDVAAATYVVGTRPDTGTLAQLLKVRARTPQLERDATIRRLAQMIEVRVNPATDVVRFFVTSPWPELSQQLAAAILSEVNRFNVDRRRSRATAERQFTEARREQARTDLRAAEERMQRFLESNRNYTGSPALTVMRDRLQRDLSLQQQVYSTLAQAYEQARVDEVRNTPVITILEQPVPPARPDSRRLVTWLAASLLVGLLAGVLAALLVDRDAHRLLRWPWRRGPRMPE